MAAEDVQGGACRHRIGTFDHCAHPAKEGSKFCRYHQPRKEVPDELRCNNKAVGHTEFARPYSRCENRALPGTNFCKIHTQGYISPRSQRTSAEWSAQFAKQDAEKRATDAAWETLRSIAAGHNDARQLAIDTLKLKP